MQPGPHERVFHAAAGTIAATAAAAAVRPEASLTGKFTGTASTYPLPAFSQARRSLPLRPQIPSPATQRNGTAARAAAVIIAAARAGLAANLTRPGTRARRSRALPRNHDVGR